MMTLSVECVVMIPSYPSAYLQLTVATAAVWAKGFVATKGWDPQTGFGQPKFGGWLAHLGKD